MECLENCFIDARPDLVADGTTLNLLELLRDRIQQCLTHGRCYFIIESLPAHRYVQGLISHRGFVLESVSNTSLGRVCAVEHGLSVDDQRALVRLGWKPPDQGNPNWFRRLDLDVHFPASLASEVLVRTLTEVHRALPEDLTLTLGHADSDPPARR